MSGTPLQVPASPASSKRSRSKDSTRSSKTNTPSVNTPFLTPSASAPSLVIPSPLQTPSIVEPVLDLTPYPAFLRLTRADISGKFADFEQEHSNRHWPSGNATVLPQWSKCSSEQVANRNRWANVDPYQHNRVKLKVPEGHNDYINASPIDLQSTASKKITRFIATQGPKDDSFSHFWRMIWHENTSPAVIVMLTKTHEAGREKCFQYYPRSPATGELKINAHDEFEDGLIHNVKIVSLNEDVDTRAQIRELDMTTEDGTETKKVWHLLFEGWPDFSIPEGADRAALLKLIDLSREKNADNSTNPRIVHCSAGVGRSGTFIALDWLLQELDEGSLDDIEDDEDPVVTVVHMLREQRMMMVQSEAQLNFIYETIRERWRERWVSLHPKEAGQLGIDDNSEPKHKKQRPSVSETDENEDMRAQLEAELIDAQAEFDKGKT